MAYALSARNSGIDAQTQIERSTRLDPTRPVWARFRDGRATACTAAQALYKQAMRSFLVHWAVTALAVGVAAYILPGVSFSSGVALAIGSLMLGLVNALVKPALVVLTLPLTVVTLGLFYLVVNGLTFALAAAVVPGFQVASLVSAVGGAVITGLVSWFVGAFLIRRR
jgi:putative membrane protein